MVGVIFNGAECCDFTILSMAQLGGIGNQTKSACAHDPKLKCRNGLLLYHMIVVAKHEPAIITLAILKLNLYHLLLSGSSIHHPQTLYSKLNYILLRNLYRPLA